MTPKRECSLGKTVCTDVATYSEKEGVFCDRHGAAIHNMRAGRQCDYGHCTLRLRVRHRAERAGEEKELEVEAKLNSEEREG
ncbi:hypothetical protein LCGC14_0294720 [marine sediment metagenome]|uniref:Uncharacterized protein n=1 Tax=marine sediment metagenome TaxID=412755 RepID=A0A0F9TX10_9ZZZZ